MAVQVMPGDGLRLTGNSHTLDAMVTDSLERWIGLIHIGSPTDGALLAPEDALALRDWLQGRLVAFADADRPEHDDVDCEKFGVLNPIDYCRECYLVRITKEA